MSSKIENITDRELLETIYDEMVSMKKLIHHIPNWISVSYVSNHIGLSNDSVRYRLVESGDYEYGKDFKYIGKRKLVVNKSVLHTLKRLRKPKGVTK